MGGMLRRNWRSLTFASVVGFSVGNYVYFLGIRQTQANVGAAIYTTYPVYISIYSIFLLDERDDLNRKFAGYALGVTGVLGLMTNFDLAALLEPGGLAGNALVVLGALMFSFYPVLGKRIQIREREVVPAVDLKFTAISMGLAAVGNLVMLAAMEERKTLFQYTLEAWALVLLLGTITTGLSMYLFFVGVREIEVSKGMSIAMLKPVLTTMFAFFILGEVPTPALLASLPLVMLAVWLVTGTGKKEVEVQGGGFEPPDS
ncbi:MAG: hypothetical protein Kow0069_34290 [Promethearchaeota archaeon]